MSPFRPWAWGFRYCWPKPVAVALTLMALGWVLVVTLFMGVAAIESGELALIVFSSAFFGAGPALPTILVAAFFAGSWPARAGILGVGTGVALLAVPGLASIGVADGLGVTTAMGLIGALPMVLVGLTALVAAGFGVRDLRIGLAEQRRGWVDHVLDARGYAWLADLAVGVSTSPDELRGWLSEVDAVLDPVAPLVWRPGHRDRKAEALVAAVVSRGRVHRSDLVEELKIRSDVVPVLLHHVVRAGNLAGYVDWEEGVVTALDNPPTEHCPRCGGDTELAGAKLVQCQHCDAEIFTG